ncbi:MAG: glycoside hydrolase family 25 protein [bacterium]
MAFLLCMCAVGAQAQRHTRGIDVSKFQGTVNWSKVVKDSTIRFVYIRATEGTSIVDPQYKTNIAKAKKAGLLVGSYHVYSSKTTAYQQMANMRKVVKKKEQDLIPVLDIEGHHSGRLNMARVDKLLELMENEYGIKPMIYTSEHVYKTHFAGKKYRKYHIFIANYRGSPTVRYTLWQYTETGHCKGITGFVDYSKFNRNHSLSDIKMPKPKKKETTPSATAADSPSTVPASAATTTTPDSVGK